MATTHESNAEPIRVEIDPDLEDLVPGFLDNRRADVATIRHALQHGDYRSIHRVGHNMKGDSGALGFDGLTDLGQGLERAADAQDVASIHAQTRRLEDYLERVEVVPGVADDG